MDIAKSIGIALGDATELTEGPNDWRPTDWMTIFDGGVKFFSMDADFVGVAKEKYPSKGEFFLNETGGVWL